MIICPCCGHGTEVSQVDIGRLSRVSMSVTQRAITHILISKFPDAVSMKALIQVVYGNLEDEQFDKAEVTMRVTISRLRDLVGKYGWIIPHGKGGFGNQAEYRLKMVGAGK